MLVENKIILLVAIFAKSILGANILYVDPVVSPSHHIWNRALARGLVEKGHNVTMLSHHNQVATSKNFTIITMEGMYDIWRALFDQDGAVEPNMLLGIVSLYEFSWLVCKISYNTKGFKVLLSYPANYKFDLIIVEATLGRCFYPLAERFHNPPIVAVTPFLLPPALADLFGNSFHTSYVPYIHGTRYSNKMSLSERVLNFIYTHLDIIYRKYIYLPREDVIVGKKFPKNKLSADELERNVSLLLCNIDPVLEFPLALAPNIIPVGGLHVKSAQPLPKDLQTIMDEAKQGVILFSLGTHLLSEELDLKSRQALLDTFSRLGQIVLWKTDPESIEELPKNVIIRKWLPQNDILGHPNTKLFISHGGALSSQEAMYHGVPVVGIPFFADQHVNIRNMEDKKIAKRLDSQELTTENVYETVKEVLENNIYRENIKKLSKIYRDQPQTALERAIFWLEYVLRHGSAEHLNIAARDMPNYQTSNLDILAVAVLGVILIYSLFTLILISYRFVIRIRSYTRKPKCTK